MHCDPEVSVEISVRAAGITLKSGLDCPDLCCFVKQQLMQTLRGANSQVLTYVKRETAAINDTKKAVLRCSGLAGDGNHYQAEFTAQCMCISCAQAPLGRDPNPWQPEQGSDIIVFWCFSQVFSPV